MVPFEPAEESQTSAALPQGGTVTIFFSDIRGFTDYTDQYGDGAAFRILQQHNRVVRRQVELFGGQVVKTQGDSFMVAFRTARAAIQCAVAVQRALASAPDEAGTRIALGIGINTGEPIQEGGDFFGGPVNLASRICSAAGSGQVLTSETTRYVAGRIESVEFVDRGLHDLKGFQEPQRLYEVQWVAAESGGASDLQEQLAALTERCSQVGAGLLDASRTMQAGGMLPPDTLGRQIAALRDAFADLRVRAGQRAAPVGIVVADSLNTAESLSELEPLVATIAQAEAGRVSFTRVRQSPEEDKARQAALEAAVQRALGVLNRVLSITHQDDAGFQPLLECQAKATELRLKLSRVASTSHDYPAERVDETIMPFADLLTLVLGRENLDDERWMQLEENVVRTLGRPLVIAATRGRLLVESARPRPRAAPPAPGVDAPRPVPEVAPPAPRVEVPRPVPAAAPPAPAARVEVERPVPEVAPPAHRVEVPRPVLQPAPPASPRRAREPVARPRRAEEPAAAALPQVDRRAAAVPWWASAHSAWRAWKSSEVATAHALRAALAKHPHLLSVHIRQATDHDEGGVAGGYFLLLEHVENLSPAFIRTAIDEAQPQALDSGPAALGRALYNLMVTKGRLRQTYPDFLRDVMVAAIPTPGVWADATITENDGTTVVTTRAGDAIGSADEQSRHLSDSRERLAEHRFAVRVAPMTARFFCLKRGDLKGTRDVAVRLTENGQPSDAALLLALRSDHLLHATPKRQGRSATSFEGLGRIYSALWIAVFNCEPEAEKPYELALSMRSPAATTRRSAFGGRR